MTEQEATVERLNTCPEDELATNLLHCCGSPRWVSLMLAQRPYLSMKDVLAKAAVADAQLSPSDWLDAFAAHPEVI